MDTAEIPVELSEAARTNLVPKLAKNSTYNAEFVEIVDEKNINKIVKPPVPLQVKELRFLAIQAITHLNQFSNTDNCDTSINEIYISSAMTQILCYINVMPEFDAKFYLLIRSIFHRYISELGYTHIIPYYNMIFNDNIYAEYEQTNNTPLPIISEEWKNEKIKEYITKQIQIERRKASKKPFIEHKVNSYVGARDKEGKWWLSKILAVFNKDDKTVYYVEFLNWGPQFNEFIADMSRIQRYNSRRHHLFRPVEIDV
jgi:hypothetical protein